MKWFVIYILAASLAQALYWRPTGLKGWAGLAIWTAFFVALPLNPDWFMLKLYEALS